MQQGWLQIPAMGLLSMACISAQADKTDTYTRSFTFDSRYIQQSDQQQDIRGLMSFGKDMTDIRGFALDWGTDRWAHGADEKGERIGMFALEVLLGVGMDQSFLTALHEQSHGSRFAAMGLKYEFEGGKDSFFPFYIDHFGKDDTYTQVTGSNWIPDKNNEINVRTGTGTGLTPYGNLLASAAGVNAEVAYSAYLQDQIYFNGGHLSHGIGMILGKMSTERYGKGDEAGNDINDIKNLYAARNIDIDEDDMDQANYIAVLLSSSTWRYLMGIYDYAQTGNTTLDSWEYYGFRLPDFSSYITSQGLSLKMDTAYRVHEDFVMTLGVEHVYKGDSATEYTVGARYDMPVMKGMFVKGYAIMGYGKGYGLESELNVTDSFSLFAGAHYDELDSLNGERYIVSLKDDDNDWSVFGGVRWYY